MAAIVTTMLCWPVWGLLAGFSHVALGVPFDSFLTFGGRLGGWQGLLAWWLIGFPPAFVYAACVLARPPDMALGALAEQPPPRPDDIRKKSSGPAVFLPGPDKL
jgi:hypothetical protein